MMHKGRLEPSRLKLLPSHRMFALRLARGVGLSAAVLGISLGSGVVGYRFVAGLEWIDVTLAIRATRGSRPAAGGFSC